MYDLLFDLGYENVLSALHSPKESGNLAGINKIPRGRTEGNSAAKRLN